MLKRYYTDLVTSASVGPRQAFRFFCDVDSWRDWSSVIRHARLFGGEWRPGGLLLFMPDLPRLPPVPIVVKIIDVQPEQSITWGLSTPVGSLLHRFRFIATEDGGCRIHHEEWSEGIVTLLAWPAGRLIQRFNDRFARELAEMF